MNRILNVLFVSFATIAVLITPIALVRAQSDASTESVTKRPNQTLYIHTFRSPSIGLEYRRGNIGLHSGLYLTNFSRSETTRFQKTGITAYFPKLDLSRRGRSEAFLSVAYVRGLNRDYRNRDGAFIEQGTRWQLTKGLEARFGAGLLLASGQRARLNPTLGISYSIGL